ncbi:YMGG-like glycine zipper-containing protein [Thermosulfurimonas sp. F29]|uniref:YMGG-like glycine zipper-containing protein n=1 Tax=Thermosulfurimonas sp. F29 TaxID=2867247 RepID=UPI001C833630|nr:YMGG-like glycine zipper-containing protein [Thermosulfurimonas sp. F29]MBX6423346.1 glycine zipper 2TM domain-containing protein [Thermosulfurimonas sp. F29]
MIELESSFKDFFRTKPSLPEENLAVAVITQWYRDLLAGPRNRRLSDWLEDVLWPETETARRGGGGRAGASGMAGQGGAGALRGEAEARAGISFEGACSCSGADGGSGCGGGGNQEGRGGGAVFGRETASTEGHTLLQKGGAAMMKRLGILGIVLVLLLSACVSTVQQASPEAKGAGLGAVVGAGLGALIDKDNPWRGAAIGAAAGAVLGGGLAHVSRQAELQAARTGRPVTYRTQAGEVVRAEPVSGAYYDPRTRTECRKVRKRVWRNGQLIEDRVEEVCEGHKVSAEY